MLWGGLLLTEDFFEPCIGSDAYERAQDKDISLIEIVNLDHREAKHVAQRHKGPKLPSHLILHIATVELPDRENYP